MVSRYRSRHARAIAFSETLEAWIFFLGIITAIVLFKTDLVYVLVDQTSSTLLTTFIAGIFFTSSLTVAPSVIALSEIAQHTPAWQVALVGGAGALLGDLFIFRFIRSHLIERIVRAAFSNHARRIGRAIAAGPLWWLTPLFGALIIVSPLPDEIGLLMMGLSRISMVQLIPLAFVANAIGIFALAAVVQSL